jgi:hypothetical protein
MQIHILAAFGCALLLAACGSDSGTSDYAAASEAAAGDAAAARGDAAPESEFGFMEAMEQGSYFGGGGAEEAAEQAARSVHTLELGEADGAPAVPVQAADTAQIAYSYSYGFRVAADRIEQVQQSHAALCEKMGPNRCRVLTLSRAGSDSDGFGHLRLQVAAADARSFGTALSKAAEEAGGEQASFALDGEDLTETIIDTEAHLASRRVLRDRLMEVLRTRQGSVGDLVQAERAVADVNEEIDSAASRLAELRNRVRMSAVAIEYGPYIAESSIGFARPIANALTSVGTTLGVTVAAIVYIAVALIPIIPFILLLRWLWRRSGFRLRRERPKPDVE